MKTNIDTISDLKIEEKGYKEICTCTRKKRKVIIIETCVFCNDCKKLIKGYT